MPTIVAMGVVYWMAMAMAMAMAAAAVGLLVVAAVAGYALVSWVRFFGVAARARDLPWLVDLAAAPAAGLAAATYTGTHWLAIYNWGNAQGMEDDPPTWFLFVGPIAFIALCWGLFGTLVSLSTPRLGNATNRAGPLWRTGSYVGFGLYGAYAGLLLQLGLAGKL